MFSFSFVDANQVRNVRLHYGGKWEEVPFINNVANSEVWNWIGGSEVNLYEVDLREYTMQYVIKLFIKHSLIKDANGLSFYYMI